MPPTRRLGFMKKFLWLFSLDMEVLKTIFGQKRAKLPHNLGRKHHVHAQQNSGETKVLSERG